MPPYTPLVTFVEDGWIAFHATIGNYLFLFEDSLYIDSYLSSLKIALVSTMLTLLLGYPISYGMMRAPRRWRFALLMMVILPIWTSFLIRVYAWIGILKKEALLTLPLPNLAVIDQPPTILHTATALYIGTTGTP